MKAVSDKALYEESQEGSIIYAPQWAMGLMYEGRFTEIAWCHVTAADDNNRFSDYAVRVRVDGEASSVDKNPKAYDIARDLRIAEIRKGLEAMKKVKSNDESSSRFYYLSDIADATETLFHRAKRGDFVGQRLGTILYVQEVAEILENKPSTVLQTIHQVLLPERRIGLNGMILTSWEAYEEVRRSLEEQFGHKDMVLSDFGSWSCAACGKHGDEFDNPADKECVSYDKESVSTPVLSDEEKKERTWFFLEKKYGHKKMSLSSFGWWSCQACGKSGDEYADPSDEACVQTSE